MENVKKILIGYENSSEGGELLSGLNSSQGGDCWIYDIEFNLDSTTSKD